MYCTAADLASAATGGWAELAQRASPEHAGLDAELLRAAVSGQSLADWTPEAQALAALALARVADAIAMAGKHIDTYLFPRYRGVMPLSPETVLASSLPAVCASLALRRLYGASAPEDVRAGTKWADAYLVDLSRGVVSIGQPDVAVAQAPGRTVVRTPPKAFDWQAY